MEFNGNKSIYLQICDGICERILSGELEPDMRIPSVREYGAEIGVNPNTVMRSYEKLTSDNIIYNRRGIGYFISQDAKQIVLQTMKRDFLENGARESRAVDDRVLIKARSGTDRRGKP